MGLKPGFALIFSGLIFLTACTEDPDILYSKAQTEAALGSRQKALNLLLDLQQASPEYTDAYLFAARLFQEDNNLPEAVRQCKRGLDAGADSARIYREIGELYYQSGSADNAYRYYLLAVECNPDNVDARISFGSMLNEKALFDQALSHFDRALELDSANYLARVGKADALRNQGKTADAIILLEQAIKSQPMQGQAYGALARAQEKTSVSAQLILDHYALSVKLDPGNQAVWDAYVTFMIEKQAAKAAVEVLQKYLNQFPTSLEGRHRLANLYVNLAQTESLSWLDAARQQCEQALVSEPDDHYSHGLLARIYLLKEKPRLALLEAQLAFEIYPSSDYRELIDQAKFLTESY